MKAYIITEGVYSDYHICGVTLDKDKAEMIKRFYSDEYDEAKIEEWEIDEFQQIYQGMKLYLVTSTKQRITVREVDYSYKDPNKVRKCYRDSGYCVEVFAFDEEQAKRIALDKIAEFKYKKSMGETE